MNRLEKLKASIKAINGRAIMNINEPSKDDYNRILNENKRLVKELAEYEKIIAELEGALKYIAITKYGLQGYVEENDEKGAYQYMSNLAFEYESKARKALQKLKEFKGDK